MSGTRPLPPPRPPASPPPSGHRPVAGGGSSGSLPPGVDPATIPAEIAPLLADPGRRLGRRLLLVDELGRGGMGVVHRAWDLFLRRHVAVKSLLTADHADGEARARFKREAQLVARLRHPGIVAVHEVDEDRGRPYLVMDLIEGESLDGLVRRVGPLPPRAAASLVAKVARAVEHAHVQGIVHRDLKPPNILIDAEGRPFVTDFGLARKTQDDAGLTRTGVFIGTPGYASPEQIAGLERAAAPASDVFGLGAVLTYALTGRAPFEGAQAVDVLFSTVRGDPDAPSRRRPGLPDALDTIALRALEGQPESRFASAGELADDLERFVAGEPILARPLPRARRAARWLRRRPVAIVGIALIPAFIVGALGVARVARQRVREQAATEVRANEGADAIAAADAAWARLQDARGAAGGEGSGDAEMVPIARDALRAALAVRTVSGGGAEAEERVRRAALALFAEALAAGEEARARWALDQIDVAAEGDAVRRARARLAAAREGDDADARPRVLEALLQAGRPDVEPGSEPWRAAVAELVGDPARDVVVATTGELLVAVAGELDDARRAAWLEVAHPTPAEAARGERTITELAEAVEFLLSAPDAIASPPHHDALQAAQRRMMGRRAGMASPLEIFARAQLDAVGEDRLQMARMAVDVLAQLAASDIDVLAPLEAYLRAERDPWRALPAAIGLCRIGEQGAVDAVVAIKRLFGPNSVFAAEIAPHLARAGVDPALDGETAEGFFRRGRARSDQGDSPGAIEDFSRAIELAPGRAPPWSARARERNAIRDFDGAIADATRALAIDPTQYEALVARGNARVEQKDFARGIADLDAAIETKPHGAIFYDRALAWRDAGDYEKALRDHGEAIERLPGDDRAIRERARTRRFAGELGGALADIERALAINPASWLSWIECARIRTDRGELDEALAAAEKAVEIATRAESLGVRGVIHQQRGRHRKAEADLTAAIEADPGNATFWSNRGRSRMAMGDFAGAFADATKATELAPGWPAAWIRLGQAASLAEDHDTADAAMTRALELQPERAAYLLIRRAVIRLTATRWTGAGEDARAAIAAGGGADAYYAHAAALEGSGDLDAAEEACRIGLARHPDSTRLYFVHARVRIGKKDHRGAIELLDHAIAVSPTSIPDVWTHRASCKLETGDLDGALADAERAIELWRDLPFSWRCRSRVRAKLGQVDAAIEDLEHAILIAPGTPEAPELPDMKKVLAELEARRDGREK